MRRESLGRIGTAFDYRCVIARPLGASGLDTEINDMTESPPTIMTCEGFTVTDLGDGRLCIKPTAQALRGKGGRKLFAAVLEVAFSITFICVNRHQLPILAIGGGIVLLVGIGMLVDGLCLLTGHTEHYWIVGPGVAEYHMKIAGLTFRKAAAGKTVELLKYINTGSGALMVPRVSRRGIPDFRIDVSESADELKPLGELIATATGFPYVETYRKHVTYGEGGGGG